MTAGKKSVDELRHELMDRFFSFLLRNKISLKEAANFAGCSDKALQRIKNGESEKFDFAYFVSIARHLPNGDAFVREVIGPIRQAGSLFPSIIPAVPANSPLSDMLTGNWVYDGDGDRRLARPDVNTALKLWLRLTSGVDARKYALSANGWVIRAANVIDYDRDHAAPTAIIACVRHLRECFGLGASVHLEGREFDVAAAIIWLEELASDLAMKESQHKHPWNITRLPLDQINDGGMKWLMDSASSDTHLDLHHRILGSPVADRCAVFNVDGENVVSMWAGPKLIVDHAAIIGRNVLDRHDIAYGRMVRDHILEACTEGHVFREMDIPVQGSRGIYRRIAVAGRKRPNGTRTVVTLVDRISHKPYDQAA